MVSFAHRVILGGAVALQMAGIAPVLAQSPAVETPSQEEAFLDILPKVVVPDDVQRIPGAVNEEFRNCRSLWPAEYALSQKGAEARAYRDIYGFVKARNVIETRGCSCAGKVANWDAVEKIASDIRDAADVSKLNWQQTMAVFDASSSLFSVAETMCGGRF